MSDERSRAMPSECELCGQPMPPGEEMFRYHGYSGPCPTAEKCKHCGEPIDENCDTKALTYKCGSAVHTDYQSDRCRIAQLEQQLATAKEALEAIKARALGNGPGAAVCVTPQMLGKIAAEALRQLNEGQMGGGE